MSFGIGDRIIWNTPKEKAFGTIVEIDILDAWNGTKINFQITWDDLPGEKVSVPYYIVKQYADLYCCADFYDKIKDRL